MNWKIRDVLVESSIQLQNSLIVGLLRVEKNGRKSINHLSTEVGTLDSSIKGRHGRGYRHRKFLVDPRTGYELVVCIAWHIYIHMLWLKDICTFLRSTRK